MEKLKLDPAIYTAVAQHYIASPEFHGLTDPLPVRSGFLKGDSDIVVLPLIPARQPRQADRTIHRKAGEPLTMATFDQVVEWAAGNAPAEGYRHKYWAAVAGCLYRWGVDPDEVSEIVYEGAYTASDREAIQEDVLGTSSDNRLILDEKTVKTHFWGELPYIHEWKKNKCSVFSDNESIRMELYDQQILNGSYKKLSDAEQNDFESLKAKQEKERSCALELNQERRTAAYEKFFGVKPNNANSHNFSKWSEATKYLGMNFYDILSEEKFEESEFRTKLVQVTSLQRAATAQAPFIHLSDSPERLRTVSSVSLASPPHPTDDFLEKLLQSLKATWGEPLKKDDDDQWFWDRGKFTAKLQKIVSAEGPAWTLKIEAKNL